MRSCAFLFVVVVVAAASLLCVDPCLRPCLDTNDPISGHHILILQQVVMTTNISV